MKISIRKAYHSNGEIKWLAPYYRDKRHGIEKYYYSNGKLSWETPFCQGKIHGVMKFYRRSGKLESKHQYLYGEEVSEEEYRRHELTIRLSNIAE